MFRLTPDLLGPKAMAGLRKKLCRPVPELRLFAIIYRSLWDFVWRGSWAKGKGKRQIIQVVY